MGESVQGAQLVGRLAQVLTAISSAPGGAPRTADLAAETGLSRSTVHRLLTALEQLGYVDRDKVTARWYLGPELYILGSVAAKRYAVPPLIRRLVAELAKATGETALLSVRRGDDLVCLLREEGDFPLRSVYLKEGMRFPLGVSAGGVALLAYQDDRFITEYLGKLEPVTPWGSPLSIEDLRERVSDARENGYSVNPGLDIEDNFGMAAAAVLANRPVKYVLSITGVGSRFRVERRAELGATLLTFAHRLALMTANSTL